MEIRYMGFDQDRNTRVYRFDGMESGQPTSHFVVTADMGLFRTHRIGIQEGPSLCAHKLAADEQMPRPATYQLTDADLAAYAAARQAAEDRRAEMRRSGVPRRRQTAERFDRP